MNINPSLGGIPDQFQSAENESLAGKNGDFNPEQEINHEQMVEIAGEREKGIKATKTYPSANNSVSFSERDINEIVGAVSERSTSYIPSTIAEQVKSSLNEAGYGAEVIDAGPKRKTGIGITIPLLKSTRPSMGMKVEEYVNSELEQETKKTLKKTTLAIAADHNGVEFAEELCKYAEQLGVGHVVLCVPKDEDLDPEGHISYAATGSAALEMLQKGQVDAVINICGNGLGALETAQSFQEAFPEDINSLYGTNFWDVADKKASDCTFNTLVLGQRLCEGTEKENDIGKSFAKAFLTITAKEDVEALKNRADKPTQAQHGIGTDLFDNLASRIERRTLKNGVDAELNIAADDKAVINSKPFLVVYDQSQTSQTMKKSLEMYYSEQEIHSCTFVPVDELKNYKQPFTHVITITSQNLDNFNSLMPEGKKGSVHAPDMVSGAAWWGKNGHEGTVDKPSVITLMSTQLQDEMTGGKDHDLLKLMTKAFLKQKYEQPKESPERYNKAMELSKMRIAQLMQKEPHQVDEGLKPFIEKNNNLVENLKKRSLLPGETRPLPLGIEFGLKMVKSPHDAAVRQLEKGVETGVLSKANAKIIADKFYMSRASFIADPNGTTEASVNSSMFDIANIDDIKFYAYFLQTVSITNYKKSEFEKIKHYVNKLVHAGKYDHAEAEDFLNSIEKILIGDLDSRSGQFIHSEMGIMKTAEAVLKAIDEFKWKNDQNKTSLLKLTSSNKISGLRNIIRQELPKHYGEFEQFLDEWSKLPPEKLEGETFEEMLKHHDNSKASAKAASLEKFLRILKPKTRETLLDILATEIYRPDTHEVMNLDPLLSTFDHLRKAGVIKQEK